MISLDRIRGMLIGGFLGDALGAPHGPGHDGHRFTGRLEHSGIVGTGRNFAHLGVGQGTDNTEMTLVLLRSIVQSQHYNRDRVVQSYLEWANSNGWIGNSTVKELMRGVRTAAGYEGRLAKIMIRPVSERPTTIESLVRCVPLALIWSNDGVIMDAGLSNPNPINYDCGLVYIAALRLALQGINGPTIFNLVKPYAQTADLRHIFEQIENREFHSMNRESTRNNCLHGLWCALSCIYYGLTFEDGVRWVITSQPGSETYAHAYLSGALLGAIAGWDQLREVPMTAENINLMLERDSTQDEHPRPAMYTLRDFMDLTQMAGQISQSLYQGLAIFPPLVVTDLVPPVMMSPGLQSPRLSPLTTATTAPSAPLASAASSSASSSSQIPAPSVPLQGMPPVNPFVTSAPSASSGPTNPFVSRPPERVAATPIQTALSAPMVSRSVIETAFMPSATTIRS